MLFSAEDRTRIAAAIRAAEAGTSGEIVVIVSTRLRRYPATALTAAALAAFTLPLAAVLLGWQPGVLLADWTEQDVTSRIDHAVQGFALVQLLLFLAVLAAVNFTPLARMLTPSGQRRDRVHREATAQFRARGLEATHGRTGVLIYVDEPEHLVEVIADRGVYEKVAPEDWGDTVSVLVDGIRAGRAADGLIAAVARAGAVLARHLPAREGNPNELPDHLIEI
jgi:putative membrane protein